MRLAHSHSAFRQQDIGDIGDIAACSQHGGDRLFRCDHISAIYKWPALRGIHRAGDWTSLCMQHREPSVPLSLNRLERRSLKRKLHFTVRQPPNVGKVVRNWTSAPRISSCETIYTMCNDLTCAKRLTETNIVLELNLQQSLRFLLFINF